jgi:serine/threonine-protein kinase
VLYSFAFEVQNKMDRPTLPQAFGPYTLRRKLASGGMAELYLSEASGPGGFIKPVVIKMMLRELGEDPRFVQMFTHEAKTVSSFVHGNIVPIFDFGEIEGRTYLAMEFIDGVDLGALSDTCRLHGLPLRPAVSLWIGIGVAAALHYAHSTTDENGQRLGVVHRDISPQNILVSRAGEVKLCDFGIAQSAATRASTDAGVIKGKLLYLSPEQARQKPLDHRCDIFSLGVTLYELLAGHHPLRGKAGVSVVRAISEGTSYPSLRETASWLPSSVAATIDKAMQFDPEKRQQSAEELRAALSRTLHSEYPDFSPESLATLVRKAQELSEQDPRTSLHNANRADLASFASETRRASQTWHDKIEGIRRRRKRLVWAAGFCGAMLLIATLYATSLWMGKTHEAQRVQSAGLSLPHSRAMWRPPRFSAPPSPPLSKVARKEKIRDRATVNTSRARTGLADINADPWAIVSIDGKSHGSTPIVGLRLEAGKHTAVLTNPDTGAVVRRVFVVKPDQTVRVIETLSP